MYFLIWGSSSLSDVAAVGATLYQLCTGLRMARMHLVTTLNYLYESGGWIFKQLCDEPKI